MPDSHNTLARVVHDTSEVRPTIGNAQVPRISERSHNVPRSVAATSTARPKCVLIDGPGNGGPIVAHLGHQGSEYAVISRSARLGSGSGSLGAEPAGVEATEVVDDAHGVEPFHAVRTKRLQHAVRGVVVADHHKAPVDQIAEHIDDIDVAGSVVAGSVVGVDGGDIVETERSGEHRESIEQALLWGVSKS